MACSVKSFEQMTTCFSGLEVHPATANKESSQQEEKKKSFLDILISQLIF
jgi:hypothetical protein